jgi:hypothetical protein
MKQRIMIALAFVAACKGKDPTELAQSSSIQPTKSEPRSQLPAASGDEPAAPPSGPASDWTSRRLVPAEGTVDGVGFALEVPDGLPRDPSHGGDWDTDDDAYAAAPKVFTQTIEIRRIRSLDDAKYHATLDARNQTWVRGEQTGDGWALTMAPAEKHRIEAIRYVAVDDSTFIKCKAVQATEGGTLPSHDKTKAMLEHICDSLKVTGVEEAAK